MKFALLLLFAPLIFCQSQPVVQDPDKASLEGQVLNTANGEPLRKVNESIEAVLKRIKISHMREEPEDGVAQAGKAVELVTIT